MQTGLLTLLICCGMLLTCSATKDEDDHLATLENEKWKVLLILIDGCRWDYVLDKPKLKGFQQMAKNGVKAQYVKPVYPSNSYPNWYSIVTGLYSESHGFIDNEMYNESSGELFLMLPDPDASNVDWWDGAIPVWSTAESQDMRTALYWWGGCEVPINGKRPRICLPHGDWFVSKQLVRAKFQEILDAFQEDQIDLAQLYYGHVDHYGHYYGPDTPERENALQDIDDLLLELQDNLTQRELKDQVNIVVVSDHGMTATGPGEVQFVDLNRFSHYVKIALGGGSRYWLIPFPHQQDKLYFDLKKANIGGIKIYKKDEIPEKYHVRNNPLTPQILIQADKGYAILPLQDSRKEKSDGKVSAGNHGYDPFEVVDMRTIFFARGPAFRKGYVSAPLENVDHYNLVCHLLDITSLPNNGSWERVIDMLDDSDEESYNDSNNAILTCSPSHLFFAPLLFAAFVPLS